MPTPSTPQAAPAASLLADLDGSQSLLRMSVGSETLAVPIEQVCEILEVSRLTPLPRTPDFVRGVMNLRGAVVPVIDLSARVGLKPTVLGRRSCIVVVETGHEQPSEGAESTEHGESAAMVVGLLVDAVFEVFDTPPSGIEAVPALGTRIPADMLAGMARAHGQVVGLLALQRVLSMRELTELIARHGSH